MNARVFLLVLFSLTFMGVWDADQRSADVALARKNNKRPPATQTPLAMPEHSPGVSAHAKPVIPVPVISNEEVSGPEEAVVQETLPWNLQAAFVLATSAPGLFMTEPHVPTPAESHHSTDPVTNIAPTPVAISEETESDEPVSHLTADTSSVGAAVLSAVGFSVDTAQVMIPMPENLASGTWQVMTESGQFFRIEIVRSASEDADAVQLGDEPLEASFCVTTTPDGTRWCFVRFHTEQTQSELSDRIATEAFKAIP